MRWIAVQFDVKGATYQEVDDYGNVLQYKDALGNVLFQQPPQNEGAQVSQANPTLLTWMIALLPAAPLL